MIKKGNIIKMISEVNNSEVQYFLPIGGENLFLNDFIGNDIKISYEDVINCIKCGKKTNKSFNQGFCYTCFLTAPEADPAVVRPELDQAHLGISRDMEWAKKYSLVEHTVYLSVTSGVKVGVTRSSNTIVRWVDQGATHAITLAKTPYRNLAGQIEVTLKDYFDDKTKWQDMLCNRISGNTDLHEQKIKAISYLPDELKQYASTENNITEIKYPVMNYPDKVSSIDIEKEKSFEGMLTGIKGQYLFFNSKVINVRKYQGYLMSFEY